MSIVIWADDLSGAANALAPFGAAGFSTLIETRLAGARSLPESGGAVCFDVNAREGGARRIPEIPAPSVLRIDSIGRGQIAELIAEVCRRFAYDAVLIAPAWPAQSRAVQGGIGHRGVDWNALGREAEALVREGAAGSGAAPKIVVADAATQDDLDALVRDAGPDTLFVGSQGIAAAVARALTAAGDSVGGGSAPASANTVVSGEGAGRGTLVVFGSVDPVAAVQRDALTSAGWPEAVFRAGDPPPNPAHVFSALASGHGAFCSILADDPGEWPAAEHDDALRELLAAPARIAATGGATGAELLRVLRVTTLTGVTETARGISEMHLPDGRTFATQPGSVGAPDDFLDFHTSHIRSKETPA